MTYLWLRTANQSANYNQGWFTLANVSSGSTVRRIRFGWGFDGFTASTTDLHVLTQNPLFSGIVTTIGDGSEVPPLPLTHPEDVAPPTERWLWWEIRQPRASSVDGTADVVSWQDSGAQQVTDVQTQVLATGIPVGQFLNVWFTWQSVFGNWDGTGAVQIFYWASLLISTP